MTLIQALLLTIAGLAAGFLAGLVGVGGGVIFTPVLFATYGFWGVADGLRTPLTVGTGLFCTGIAAGAGTVHHARKRAVRWKMAAGVGLASAGGIAVVSGLVVIQPWYNARIFQLLFSVVLLVVIVRILRPSGGCKDSRVRLGSGAGWGSWIGTGTAAGAVASAVGVGGGVVLVPGYSRLFRMPFHRAVGTSSATILVISVLSTGAYAVSGADVSVRPFSLGYVDLGTGLALAVPAVFGAQGGARLAHRLETTWLRWSFALLGLVVATRLVWNALGAG